MDDREMVYVGVYVDMVKYLKALYHDVSVLHHNIKGANFFANHEALGDMYEHIADMLDDLIELGMTIGIYEPSIEDSLKFKPTIPVRLYTANEAFSIVVDEFKKAIELMSNAKNFVPEDIKAKIEEYQHTLRIDGLYKAQMLLEE